MTQPSTITESMELRGRVERVYFSEPAFTAGRMVTNKGEAVQFAGKLYAREHQPIVLRGAWGMHPKYGHQFQVESAQHDLDLDRDGLAHYLAHHPDIKGIGPVKAKRLVEEYGDDFEGALHNQPEQMAKAVRVKPEVIHALRDEWTSSREVNAVLAWLSNFGLTHGQVTKLVDSMGGSAAEVLKENPYLLLKKIPGFGFRRLDQVALNLGYRKEFVPRVRAGIRYVVGEQLDQGHVWTASEELLDFANDLLVLDNLDARDRIKQALNSMIEERVLHGEKQEERLLVALPSMWRMEQDLIAMLRERPNPHFQTSGIEEAMEVYCSSLNESQRQAAYSALRYGISVISGSGGTGKTYTISSLVTIAEEFDLEVTLCAPTGKAARRMESVTGHESMTVHRLLGYNGTTYKHGADNQLETDVLILDECSMADLPLLHRLFQAVNLETTSVVLVGDHNQLPPVGPGNVLRDLINKKPVPVTVLEQVVRQAGILERNCSAILKGEIHPTSELVPGKPLEWCLMNDRTDEISVLKYVVGLFRHKLEPMGYDLLRDVQLLTPTNKGLLGTASLNKILQELLQEKLFHFKVEHPKFGLRFHVHDKVIQVRNNYRTGVMNGSQGYVTHVSKEGDVCVAFEDRQVCYEKGSHALKQLKHGYALTVHKSQGSEYPCVIAVIHKAHSFMLNRAIFYTSVGRAQKTAIIVGDRWGIANCAKKNLSDDRRTFMSIDVSEDNGNQVQVG